MGYAQQRLFSPAPRVDAAKADARQICNTETVTHDLCLVRGQCTQVGDAWHSEWTVFSGLITWDLVNVHMVKKYQTHGDKRVFLTDTCPKKRGGTL